MFASIGKNNNNNREEKKSRFDSNHLKIITFMV
jgi:hypothetical protein